MSVWHWETAHSTWLEDEPSGRFALERTAGLGLVDWAEQGRGRAADIAQLLGASLPAACTHSAIFPEGFTYCPACGAALQVCAEAPQPEWWSTGGDPGLPKHVPQGLPVTSLPLAAGIEPASVTGMEEVAPSAALAGRPDLTMPAPPNSPCVFAAASFGFAAQRLLALAYTRNVLQYWDPNARMWHLLQAEEGAASLAFQVSDYAWLPLAPERRGEVAIVPTAGGLLRLRSAPLADSYHTEPVLQAPLVSAPGAVRRMIACLFNSGEGVRLWTAKADGADPQVLHCPGAALPAEGWARPLSYDGRLIWLHGAGHLIWQPGSAPVWLPWPPGWTPRLNFGGATQSRDGRLWLIGHDGQGYAFVELGIERGDYQRLDGARLGFGSFLFRRGHPVINDPWDAETVEDQQQEDSLVLPLLQNFNGARNQPTGLVLRFGLYTGKAEAALENTVIPRTTVEWIGRHNVVLDEIVRLERPALCQPFVYAGSLWLHHPDWDQMRGWRLAVEP
jgi:hypothetical protein